MNTKMPIPAKALLTTKLQDITPIDLRPLIDDLGRDVGRIESLVSVLTQYKEDVFANGIANLAIWMTEWPMVTGRDNDSPIIAWRFQDRFRSRSFVLLFDISSEEFSATGEEQLEPRPARPVQIDVTPAMIEQLKARLSKDDFERVNELVAEWTEKHPIMTGPGA